MTTLYVHVGYPKTATTTLQKHLFAKHSQIDYLGKYHPDYQFRNADLTRELGQLVAEDESQYAGTQRLHELINELRASSGRPAMVLSHESLLHVAAGDRGVVARRLKEAFSPCRIILTIREQLDIVRSFYGRHGRFGQYLFMVPGENKTPKLPLTFSDWMHHCMTDYHRNFLATLQYNAAVKLYADLFGEENLLILLYEDLARDPVGYLERLTEYLGIHQEEAVGLAADKHELARLSALEQRYYDRLGPKLKSWGLRTLAGFIEQRIDRWTAGFAPATIEIRDAHRATLRALYAEGNRKLQENYNLPLAESGYAT